MVEIVHEAKWILDGGTVGGANTKGGEGWFQHVKVGICMVMSAAWVPRRKGGKGCDRADTGRSSAAPLHGYALRMRIGKTHRTGGASPAPTKARGGRSQRRSEAQRALVVKEK